MKRLFVTLLVLALAVPVFAAGSKEMEITALGVGTWPYTVALEQFAREYPNIKVRALSVDQSTGETITIDALVAAGTPPDVYVDFVGRAAKYKVTTYAEPLTIDETPFVPALLDWGRVDGVLYGVPMTIPGQAMVLNMDILNEVGYVVPDRWTTVDFIEMAERVKAAGYFATVLFAANPSADYLYVNWFGSFGAQFYDKGFTRSTLDNPAGLQTFVWYNRLLTSGYVPAGPQSITDDDALEIWQTGKVAAMPIRPSWIAYYLESAVKNGMIKEPFNVQMVPFPRAPGVAGVPTIGAGNMIIVAKQTDAVKRKAIMRLVELLAGPEVQAAGAGLEGVATRTDIQVVSPNVYEEVVSEIAAAYGWMEVGYHQPWYYEVRALLPEVLRSMYTGRLTPEQARDAFVAGTNAILTK